MNRTPDPLRAQSLISASEQNLVYTRSLTITTLATPTIIRNVYESFRMLGQALLYLRGTPSRHHTIQIAIITEQPIATDRPLRSIERLRTLRHAINYQGYLPNEEEARDALSIADDLFEPLVDELRRLMRTASDRG